MPDKNVCVTSKQHACAHEAEREADDGGLVQISAQRWLQGQKSRQVTEHIRLHATPFPGGLTADGSAATKKELFRKVQRRFSFFLFKCIYSL